jgi:hypothetical protein
LWFRTDGPEKASGYNEKWAKYRLAGTANAEAAPSAFLPSSGSKHSSGIKETVEGARKEIAEVAGVPVEAVKITINLVA